ncbi:cupredoxin domain-containing protein [Glaciecola sp. SC05]|uniref:cupredoxin domain-containing protein n=1 Tax=Glaciecola sp. SC05 TaxID=1987355 RepID=UPI0035270252
MFSQMQQGLSQVWWHRRQALSSLVLLSILLISPRSFTQQPVFTITLSNHTFSPDEIVIPAHTKVQLIIENNDDQPEEFDSFDLNREKVIFPNRKVRLFIGPLLPGEYEYFGEFHPDTARGRVIVREPKLDKKTLKTGEPSVN